MSGIFGKMYAYLYLRGFKIWISYKTQMILNVLAWVLPVFTYYFVGTSLGERVVGSLGIPDYTSFFVVGLAFQGYVSSVINTISQRMRNEQLYGTLEYYILTPTGVWGFLLYSSLWGFVLNTVNAMVILSVGVGLGIQFHVNSLSTLLITMELVLSTLGIAMMSGAITLMNKQGNPVAFFFATFTTLMSGTVFPVRALPTLVRDVSYMLPLTWALDGLRKSMLLGYGLSGLWRDISILFVMDVVTMTLGYLSFRFALHTSKGKGTLGEY